MEQFHQSGLLRISRERIDYFTLQIVEKEVALKRKNEKIISSKNETHNKKNDKTELSAKIIC